MAIAAGDLYRGAFAYMMANQQCMNVFHFRAMTNANNTGGSNTLMSGLLNKLTTIAQAVANVVHEDVQFISVGCNAIHTGASVHSMGGTLSFTGAATGELLPGFVALPFYLETDFGGRSRRGRSHIGGWSETDQDAGRLVMSGATKAEALRTQMQTELTTGTSWRAVVYSRKIAIEQGLGVQSWPAQVEGAAETPWAYITAVNVGDVLGSMYSRKIGRGQ